MALKYSITHNGNTWNSSTDLDTINISNGSVTSSITEAGTKALNCAGKVAANNIVIGDKTLNCAGKIMTGNVSIVAEDAIVYLPVGGRIFYDNGSNGATYTFYDANKNIISDTTISSLANAVYYSIKGTPTTDRWYVYDTNFNSANTYTWATTTTSIPAAQTNTIGSGKTNTATITALNYGGTAWTYISGLNSSVYQGCNDWFVGSKAEYDVLRTSGTPGASWFAKSGGSYIWSSVEYSSYTPLSWRWSYDNQCWNNATKSNSYCVLPLRAF